MIVEIGATLAACWIGWQLLKDSARRIHPRLTARKYRRRLRRLCEIRYRRTTVTRQQVRVLEHFGWQMRADGSLPPNMVHCMRSVDVMPFIQPPKLTVFPPHPDGCTGMVALIRPAHTETEKHSHDRP